MSKSAVIMKAKPFKAQKQQKKDWRKLDKTISFKLEQQKKVDPGIDLRKAMFEASLERAKNNGLYGGL